MLFGGFCRIWAICGLDLGHFRQSSTQSARPCQTWARSGPYHLPDVGQTWPGSGPYPRHIIPDVYLMVLPYVSRTWASSGSRIHNQPDLARPGPDLAHIICQMWATPGPNLARMMPDVGWRIFARSGPGVGHVWNVCEKNVENQTCFYRSGPHLALIWQCMYNFVV